MELHLERLKGNGNILNKQTLGVMSVYDSGHNVFVCKTLELPWKDNQQNISCIPTGKYKVKKRTSEKYGEHFHVLGVPNRSYILIHPANFVRQLRGCIAPGEKHIDIDGDGNFDVTSSKKTMRKLLALLPDEFELTINES